MTQAADANAELSERQASIAARYARLEELLLRLADVEARENPQRAALLKRVAKQSRQKFVLEKLRDAGTLISKGQLGEAVADQQNATEELRGLLKLLMSEDRSTRIRDEKKRIAELIKQLRLAERNERSVRARTENGVELREVREQQKSITEKTEKLSNSLGDRSEQDESDDDTPLDRPSEASDRETASEKVESESEQSSDDQPKDQDSSLREDPSAENAAPSESPPRESPMGESPRGETQSREAQSSESPSGGSPSDPSPPSASEPNESPSNESQPNGSPSSESASGDPSSSPPRSPEEAAEQRVERAIERMKAAEQRLAQNNREGATAEQRRAEEELRQAIDQLEQILRQLREEEIQRELARLEARLQRMLAMQTSVRDETVQLAKTPLSQRSRTTILRAGDFSFEEQKITLEADRAMLLLREEGSSVAFPEVVSQLRDDTQTVAQRLGQARIDSITQGIQNDILSALEEMIAALQKAQRDLEAKQQQQQGGQQQSGGSGNEPLVEAIAELKLIRTMQTRIQGSTDRYGRMMEDSSDSLEDVLPLLQDLSLRQDRLYKITRDLVTKRNQ
ncbi:MAG: hypothetical protein AAF670_11010 [Planctomycetota bacterium]